MDLSWKERAQAQFGSSYEHTYNADENFVLVFKKISTRPADAYPTLRFFIFDIQADEVIFDKTEIGGKAEWENPEVVKVTTRMGIPNPNSGNNGQNVYRYHVKNRKKYSGSFLKPPK